MWPEGYGAGPGPDRPYQTFYCQRCGAVVMSIRAHNQWHQGLDLQQATKDDVKVAKRADT